jgi:hypothetical protein
MRTRLVATSVAAVALLWVGTSAQLTQPLPGPGSGIVKVEGTVDVRRMPVVSVNAAQQGDWRVAIANTPTITVASPAFVKVGARYQITWATGERELVQVAAVEPGGWVRVADKPDRWINISSARSLATAP